MRTNRRWLLSCLPVLLALPLIAQDFDDDSDEAEPAIPAMLSLDFNRQGALDARLGLPQNAANSDPLPDLLALALHCPLGAVKHPDLSDFSSSRKWSAAKRERFRQAMGAANQRQFEAHCGAAMGPQGQLLQADFDLSSVTAELRRMGVDQLTVYVDTPEVPFRDYSRASLMPQPTRASRMLVYTFSLAQNTASPGFHLAYGFRPADLYRAFAILVVFILAPVMFTLWMRRRALASAQRDPAGAWFGFFRTLNWLVNGAMLVWITSGLGARHMLQQWVLQQGFSSFRTALADVTLAIVPSFLVYFFCVVLSYPVHAQLRGSQWTRTEFLWRQLITVGAQAIPLMMALAGIQILRAEPELAAVFLILTVVAAQVFQVLKLRVIKEFPHPLTTGELRDRIFSLARRLGVSVTQIFVLPAGKGQVANAFAARNRIVMFTDYLLEHLSKAELDGVAAHELGHLRHKHPSKLGMALIAAIFLPSYFNWLAHTVMGLVPMLLGMLPSSNRALASQVMLKAWAGLNAFELWSQRDLLLLLTGMTGFYFLSRHFEYVADATAVSLTGNAEAQITGLLKVNRLNLIPIRWGKASEGWLTHPATIRRAERMAAVGGLAPERLEQILHDYDSQDAFAKPVPPEDRYTVPHTDGAEKLRVALRERSYTQVKLWLQLLSFVVPPAVFSFLIPKLHLSGITSFAAYLSGIIVTAIVVTLVAVWTGESGKAREKRRLIERFAREGVPAGLADDIAVGFAPGPYPRVYGSKYQWGSGFLILSKDHVQFVGEQVKFSFTRSEIDGITIGRGGPSWWKFERIYVRWKTADGHNGIFNLNSLEPGSAWDSRAQVRALGRRLQEWHRSAGQYPIARPGVGDLKALNLGQVTSVSPKQFGSYAITMRVLLWLVLLAIGTSMLTHADKSYLLLSVILVRLVQSVPYWRYRDIAPKFSQPQDGVPEKGAAAGA